MSATVDGEGFGRDGIYRQGRFGCIEIYVGEFDEDPPSEPTATELWEQCVGGEPPADMLKNERLDKELMRIGKHEHMRQLDETKRKLDFAASGPTVRMVFVGKRTKNTNRKRARKRFFSKGGSGGEETPETPITFGDSLEEEGGEESKCEEFDEEESPKELEIASQNLRVRGQWLKKEMSAVGADPKHEKVMDEINEVTLEVAKIESRLMDMGKGSQERSDSSEESKRAPEGMPKGEAEKEDAGGQVASYAGTLMKNVDEGSGSRDPPSRRQSKSPQGL